jgi:hypothetical protein
LGARGRTRTKVDTALVLGLLSAGACAASAAQAQDMVAGDTALSVQKRPRPDFDAVPIRFGAFEVSPAAETRLSFDDNIYATRADKVDDALATIAGSLSAHSTWSRHAVSLDADAALTRGLSQRAEDTQTYAVQAGGRLGLGVATQVSAHAGYSRAYEPRGSVGDTTLRGRRIAYNTQTALLSDELVASGAGIAVDPRYTPSFAAAMRIILDDDAIACAMSQAAYTATRTLALDPGTWIERLEALLAGRIEGSKPVHVNAMAARMRTRSAALASEGFY